MFIKEFKERSEHRRTSKLGIVHTYYRTQTLIELRCDNCGEKFVRSKSKIDPRRLNNNYFHVCGSCCDPKKFAQRRGVERKRVWDLPASSDIPISKL